ncbi:MAG: ferrochelatase [Bacteroidota bacterium]
MNTIKTSTEKIAVVLFQLGGPDSLDAVEPFLLNLFRDPDIIDFPFAWLAREPLARFIVSKRLEKVKEHYSEIGGKSPIRELTERQATLLEKQLQFSFPELKVFVAMRYWKPTTEETVLKIKKEKFDKIILLPLYPQFSFTTTSSSINEWNRQIQKHGLNTPSLLIEYFYTSELYIQSLVERISDKMQLFNDVGEENVQLVFSAHGVPVSIIKKGDRYQQHIEDTVHLILEKGNWKSPHHLCYQSKVGPMKWLQPSLDTTIRKFGLEKKDNLLIVPVAFVTDHIETLHEINIETREHAKHLGVTRFEMTQGLNDSHTFICALTELVNTKIAA